MKKLFIFIMSITIGFSVPIADGGSTEATQLMVYSQLVANINQTTELINKSTEQIKGLFGVRQAVSDVKASIYNAKDTIENSVKNLDSAIEGFEDAIGSIETQSLFDTNRESIGYYGEGIFTQDIKGFINKVIGQANEATKEETEQLKRYNDRLAQINKALVQKNAQGFVTHINKALYDEKKKIQQQIRVIENAKALRAKQTRAAIANEVVEANFKKLPTNPDAVAKGQKELNRLKDLLDRATKENATLQATMVTNNLLLVELLKKMTAIEQNNLNYQTAVIMAHRYNITPDVPNTKKN